MPAHACSQQQQCRNLILFTALAAVAEYCEDSEARRQSPIELIFDVTFAMPHLTRQVKRAVSMMRKRVKEEDLQVEAENDRKQ